MMEDHQTWDGNSNGYGYGYGNGAGYGEGNGYGYGYGDGRGNGSGSGGGSGGGSGNGNEDGNGWGSINLYILFPIPGKYYYLLENQTIIQKVKIRYDLHNASNQEEIDLLVEWYETVQEIEKAK